MFPVRQRQLAEVRKGVFHPVAPKIRGLAHVLRRIRQALILLTSKNYSTLENINALVQERYSQAAETDYYQSITHSGLYREEEYATREALKRIPSHSRALVVGCGTGREAIGLQRLGLYVMALDNSEKMIQLARDNCSAIDFRVGELRDLDEKFDLIFITYALTNHIISQQDRLEFFRACAHRLKNKGLIVYGAHLQKIRRFDRFWWSSLCLRWRMRRTGLWSKNLVARAHLGHYNDEIKPLPFYFYQNSTELEQEFTESNLQFERIKLDEQPRESGYENLYFLSNM